jgi:hypothetical protein
MTTPYSILNIEKKWQALKEMAKVEKKIKAGLERKAEWWYWAFPFLQWCTFWQIKWDINSKVSDILSDILSSSKPFLLFLGINSEWIFWKITTLCVYCSPFFYSSFFLPSKYSPEMEILLRLYYILLWIKVPQRWNIRSEKGIDKWKLCQK